jgi:ATP-dependent Zn protease
VEWYAGMGASHVRDLFARDEKDAPLIISINEIDVFSKVAMGESHNDEHE